MKKITLLLCFIILYNFSFSQSKSEKVGQYWTREIVTSCVETPNKLKVSVLKYTTEKGISKIWSVAEWQGRFTTLNYIMKLYIEDSEKGVIIYFLDYSNTLAYICIDLKNTKPITFNSGSVQYFPYKEFEHKEIN